MPPKSRLKSLDIVDKSMRTAKMSTPNITILKPPMAKTQKTNQGLDTAKIR